ncbi:MAG: hypothetical protein WBE72_06760 [Terracidiphilus sp.]
MNGLRVTSLLLACALLAPAIANAKPKPLDPVTVHDRIAKRGVGNWICVEEANGIALVGRVVSIDDQSVGLQLANYPEITPVLYTDIVGLRLGWSKKAFFTVMGVGLASVAIMAAVGIHEVNQNRAQFPATPAVRWGSRLQAA